MDDRFFPLWSYLKEEGLLSFSVDGFKDYLTKNNQSFAFDICAFNDEELFTLLFIEVEKVIDAIVVDDDFSKKDQIFEGFMTVFDYLAPYHDLFLTLEKDLVKRPCFLKTFLYKKDKLLKKIEHKYSIKAIELNFSQMPFLKNIFKNDFLALPNDLNFLTLKGLIISMFLFWNRDFSEGFESTMVKLDMILDHVKIV